MNKRFIAALYVFSCVLLIGMWFTTQELAAAVEYSALLGAPLLIIDNKIPIYTPWKYVEWYFEFGKVIPKVFDQTSIWVYVSTFIAFIAAGLVARKPKSFTSHGTATWADEKDIVNAGLLDKPCLFGKRGKMKKIGCFLAKILGKKGVVKKAGVVFGLTERTQKYLRHDGPEHMIVMAPTRSGKGVSVIIPTLLTWLHSAIVTDIKGENWGITAGFRKYVLRQKVIKFEPTSFDNSSARFNPFDEIRIRTPREVSDIQNITNIIVDPQGKGDLNHWQMAAQSLLVGAILHLKYVDPENASLGGLVKFLTEPSDNRPQGIIDVLNEMKDMDHVSEGDKILAELYNTSGYDVNKHPIVRQTAMEMLQKAEEELAGVVSTVTAILSVYRDPILAKNLSSSTFRINDLMNHAVPVSLYLVVPPSDLDRMNPVFRLIVELIVRRSIEKMEFEDGKAKQGYKHKLLLLLDEFPGLGRLDTMERSLAYIAGYGIKALIIVQSLNQLNKIYTEKNSIVDNCHVRIFFTPNDVNTPEYITKMLGKYTEVVTSESTQKNEIFGGSLSTSSIARDLMTSGEVAKLGKEDELVFVTGFSPIKAKKIRYYEDENFKTRLMNAPSVSDSTVDIVKGGRDWLKKVPSQTKCGSYCYTD